MFSNNTESAATVESVPKPSEDTMDTNDAQISLGSGEGDAVSAVISETSIVNSNNPATEISNNESEQKKTIVSIYLRRFFYMYLIIPIE